MASKEKKSSEKEEVWENPEVLAEKLTKSEEFLNQNKALVGTIITVMLLVVAGVLGFRYYNGNKNAEAQSEMFQAVYYYEQDSLEKALRGDGNIMGLVDIALDYSNTDAGNLAQFYVGDIYVKQGKFNEALLYLEDFSSKDLVLQARAYALLGDVFMEQSNFEKALDYYNQAISFKPNEQFTPEYIKKAAVAAEKLNNKEEAIKYYRMIVEKYKGSALYGDAQKQLARLGVFDF